MHMKRFGAHVSEAVFAAGWNNKRLPANQDGSLFIDPHLGLTRDYRKHFLDRMTVCRSSHGWRHPLLEYAQLSCTVAGRNMHSGFYSGAPFLALLFSM